MNVSWRNGVLPLMLLLGCVAGCTSWDVSKSIPFLGSDGKVQQPSSVMAFWTDTVRHEPGTPPTRGFVGRLVFYGKDGVKPIKVDGSLDVYGFLESASGEPKPKPDKKFSFTPEEFATHYSREKIGPAYSVWIPWDAAGGLRQDLSLICRFAPKGGSLIVSEQSRHLLPGAEPPQTAKTPSLPRSGSPAARSEGVQQVAYQTPMDSAVGFGGEPAANSPSVMTTTIQLPSNFGRGALPGHAVGNGRGGAMLPGNPAAPAPMGGAAVANPAGMQHYAPAQPMFPHGAAMPQPNAAVMAANAPGAITSPATQNGARLNRRGPHVPARVSNSSGHSAAQQAMQAGAQRPGRFAPPQPQAPAAPTAPQGHDPAWWPPSQ